MWSELQSYIMGIILRRLPLFDYIRCRAVCKSWRQACSEEPPTKRQPPVLLFRRDIFIAEFVNLLSFLGPQPNKCYRVPEISDPCFLGSSCGWIVFCNRYTVLRIFNPFNGAHIDSLPSITGMIFEEAELNRGLTTAEMVLDCFQRVVVFPVENQSSPSVVVFIVKRGYRSHLAFAEPGDESWRVVDHHFISDSLYYDNSEFFEDVTLHDGQFYAVSNLGTLVRFDFKQSINNNKPHVVVVSPCSLPDSRSSYLFESLDGSQLMLVKEFKDIDDIKRRFRVFRFDRERAKWIEAKRLSEEGDAALFVGLKSQPLLISAHYFPAEVSGDCIYFSDPSSTEDESGVGVYNMRDGSILHLSPFSPRILFKPPVWFMPALSS